MIEIAWALFIVICYLIGALGFGVIGYLVIQVTKHRMWEDDE